MNIRVWIDLNRDGIFSEPSETMISKNYDSTLDYKGFIVIPSTATPGLTRMRVGVKMSSYGGHTLPTPCALPTDPLGWHGEIEDYDLIITNGVGIENVNQADQKHTLYPNPANDFLEFNSFIPGVIKIYDITGKIISQVQMNQSSLKLDISNLSSGVYFVIDGSNNYYRFIKQ